MKYLSLILFFSLTTYSQLNLDSSQVSKLIIKLNLLEYQLAKDSLDNIELAKKDTVIENQSKQITNQKIMIGNLEIDISFLRSQAAILKAKLESGLKWYHYGGFGVLLTIIGYLAGHL